MALVQRQVVRMSLVQDYGFGPWLVEAWTDHDDVGASVDEAGEILARALSIAVLAHASVHGAKSCDWNGSKPLRLEIRNFGGHFEAKRG